MTDSTRAMSTTSPRRDLFPRVAAVVVAVLGVLPLANWVAGGHEAPTYASVASEWVSGSAIVLGLALVGFIVVRRIPIWPTGLGHRIGAAAAAHPRLVAGLLALASFCLYATIARTIYSGRPLLIDEIVQMMQARIFAEGRITRAVGELPEFFSAMHVVDVNGRVFSQYPPGGPLMLLPGVLLGAPWITGPVFGALSAALFWLTVRQIEPRPAVALGAALLFAAAPFTAFMAGSHMNHVPALTWLLVALWALARLVETPRAAPSVALLCGLGFGLAASIRPVDGAVFAVPAAVWLVARVTADRTRWRDLIAAGIGVALPLGGVLAYNAATTGDPLLFGYELLWGKSHALGFHAAPWGVAHSPLRGLELVNLIFLRLQTYLYETPVPALAPFVAALALTRSVRGFDRYLLWSSALLVFAYFAYWHDGYYLGPRFAYPLLPMLVLWTARLPALVRERWPRAVGADRGVLLLYLAAAAVAIVVSVPMRARQYARGMTSMRLDYIAPARAAGVKGALILVREGWGAQVVARLWALGVPRSETEALYRAVDTCILEQAVSRLERGTVRGAAAFEALRPLMRDSLRLVQNRASPDPTERLLPGTVYPPVCQRRLVENRAGYTFLAPVLAQDPGTNVYARELHGRDTLLFARYPGRPVYVLRPSSSAVGAPLGLYPFAADSARAAWAEAAAAADAGVGAGISPASPSAR